ncbi:MAG TPA: hypothetical protein VLU94_00005 [Candidatus Nitrosotalea sp.]|nr:hypothetical protein [Candidatus Nitrosotalea sp.]
MMSSGVLNQNVAAVTLPADGTYHVLIQGTGQGSTPVIYQLRLSDVSDAPAVANGLGVVHSGTLAPGQTNGFTFTAPAGLPVFFDSQDNSGVSLLVDVIDPFGNGVLTTLETGDTDPYMLPRSGTYTVVVRGAGGAGGNYRFRLLDMSTSPQLLLNTVVSNVLSAPYQTDIYQLQATAGQRLYYDAIDSDFDPVTVRLIGPDGLALIGGNSDSDHGPVTLRATGTYYLIVQTTLSTGPDYVFRLLDVAAQPVLPLNTDFSGTLAPSQSAIYRLAGMAGQQLYFNGEGISGSGASWTLFDPNDTVISSSSLPNGFETTLGLPGQYVLVLNNGISAVTYTNQVNTFGFVTNALTLGTVTSGNIVHPGDQVYYTFNGTAGQRVFFDSRTSDSSIRIYTALYSPGRATVFSGYSYQDIGPVTLPETGTYLLQLDGYGAATGAYSFNLLDVGSQPVLPLNTDMSGTLVTNVSLVYQLSGSAGQQLYFNGKGASDSGANWYLYDPGNTFIGGVNLPNGLEITLSTPGQYVVVVNNGVNAVTYTNQVNTFGFVTNALTLGAVTSGNIVHPGDQVYYTFNGTAGQRVFFDSRNPDSTIRIYTTLHAPGGATVFSAYSYQDIGPVTLSETGTYLLQFDGYLNSTGPYSFNLLDVGSQPVLPLNTDVSGTLVTNTSLVYQLSGSAGQQFYFNCKGASDGGANWFLYDPGNTYIGGAGLPNGFETTLGTPGQYVLVVNNGVNPVTYTNQVNTFGFVTNALTLSAVTSGNIVHPGDQVYYTFSGTAGQRLYFDTLNADTTIRIYTTLYSPSRNVAFSGYSYQDMGPLTLTETGTYLLELDGYIDSTGPYSFNLLDLALAPVATPGVGIVDSLSSGAETRWYRLNGTTGQRLNFRSVSASSAQAQWKLIGPANQPLTSAPYINQDIGIVTLPADGVYAILVTGYGSGSSPLNYDLSITDVSDAPIAANGFGVVHSGTLSLGQTNSFLLAASAGLPVYFDSLDNTGQALTVDLIDPFGGVVFSINETYDTGPYVLPRSGTYTLSVRGSTGGGSYNFRLLDLSTSPVLPMNTVVSNVLSAPFQTDIYQFAGSAGQRLYYDALEGDFDAVQFRLLGADGQTLLADNSDNDKGPLTLPLTGTLYLFFQSGLTTSPNYVFQMLDLASQPALPVNVGATNTMLPYATVMYRYSGVAGQHLFFAGQPGNLSGYWTLYDPNNSPMGSAGLAGVFEETLPATGTYALTFYTYNGSTGSNTFTVNDYSYVTNSYTLGTSVSGTITRPGEQRFYTFTGTNGHRLYYVGLTNQPATPNSISVQVLNPEGGYEGPVGGGFDQDRGPWTLQQSGVYTLIMDGSGASVGDYGFRLLDLTVQPVLPLNVPVTNSMPAYGSLMYQYSGVAGQRLFFDGQPGNPGGNWALYDPNNNTIGGSGLTGDFEVTLPTTGTYALVLFTNNGNTNNNVFEASDYSYATNSYTMGTSVSGTITRPGERRFYTFTGTNGHRLYYDGLTNQPSSPDSISVQVLNPEGGYEGPVGGGFDQDRGLWTLQQSGVYTLVLDGNAASVGDYGFRLLDLTTQPVLPLNSLVTNSMPAYGVLMYQYSGVAGQNLFFDGQPGNPSGFWTLYDPNNNAISGASLGGDFEETLPLTGTYALVLYTYNGVAAPSSFEVFPFNYGEPFEINRAPSLAAIGNQEIGEDVDLTFRASATDPDGDGLAFSLDPGAPSGASIDPVSGVFHWAPPPTGYSGFTNITVRVTDNGTPPLSDAQTIAVQIVAGPVMIGVQRSTNSANVMWRTAPGKQYQLQYKDTADAPTWNNLGPVIIANSLTTSEVDSTIGADAERYYRVEYFP